MPHLHSSWSAPQRPTATLPTGHSALAGIHNSHFAAPPAGPFAQASFEQVAQWNAARRLSSQTTALEKRYHSDTIKLLNKLAVFLSQLRINPQLERMPPPTTQVTAWHLERSTAGTTTSAWHWHTYLQIQSLLTEVGKIHQQLLEKDSY